MESPSASDLLPLFAAEMLDDAVADSRDSIDDDTTSLLTESESLMSRQTNKIRDLVQGFAKHIRQLKAPDYKESQVRRHYIDPFWELLGWDVNNDRQCAPQDVEVVIEPSMDSVEDDGLRSRAPDYLFRVN